MFEFNFEEFDHDPVLITVTVLAVVAFIGYVLSDFQQVPYSRLLKYVSVFNGLCSVISLSLMLSGNEEKVEKYIFIILSPFLEEKTGLPEKSEQKELEGEVEHEVKKK